MKTYTLIATAPMGIEAIVAKEVRDLGYECTVDNGKVIFQGDALAICRANLWLRTADRIKVQVAEFSARTFDELLNRLKPLTGPHFYRKIAHFPSLVNLLNLSLPVCRIVSASSKGYRTKT